MEFYRKAVECMDMDAVEFSGGASEAEIEAAMNDLSVIFPKSYRAFLAEFGSGDVGGEVILGLSGCEEENTVEATRMERKVGLPASLVIISVADNSLYCLDTAQMKQGECPVVLVDPETCTTETIAESFGKFLYDYESEDE